MRGGSKWFVAIESKSFDFEIVGFKEYVLRISENGRRRRFSLLLPEPVSLWLLRLGEDLAGPIHLYGAIKCGI